MSLVQSLSVWMGSRGRKCQGLALGRSVSSHPAIRTIFGFFILFLQMFLLFSLWLLGGSRRQVSEHWTGSQESWILILVLPDFAL